ncbi:MAG TPA: peptidoglycan recognition family protein [Gaiellaceae bacterium]|nr:peptidoglycan recognition family protein [Gaiellaceae bacterium]
MESRHRRALAAGAATVASALALTVQAAASPPQPAPSGKGPLPAGAHTHGSGSAHNRRSNGAECPPGLACDVAPAAYAQNSADPGDYGNYDLANRPADGLGIRFVVVHDTEEGYDPTIAEFQDPLAYVSAHYVVRSSDGAVTQMVPTADVAWQAGNWWINTHSVGIENEGYALNGSQWFTNRLYHSLARLTRYQAERFGIPLDREHIIGHDQVPGPTTPYQAGMHWDPGPYFDWAHFMALVGAPITPRGGDPTGRIVTIDPNFATNDQLVTGCDAGLCAPSGPQPSNFVYLHTAPSADSPLVADPLLAAAGTEPDGTGTTLAWDWGDKAVTGQTFAVADRRGDWVAVWYGGQEAWLYDPQGSGSSTIPGNGTLVTPRPGLASIPVYGRAYPSSVSTDTLGYTIPAGQEYVAKDLVGADYYSASTFNAPSTYSVQRSAEQFYEISFNHRIAFVRASDVAVVQ